MSWQGSLEDGASYLGRPGQGPQWDGLFLPLQLSGVLFVDTVICSSFAYHLLLKCQEAETKL